MNRTFAVLLAVLLLPPLLATGQTLDIRDAVKSYATLSNTTVTLSGRAELRVTGTNDPLPGCVIHLNSPDAWLLLSGVAPSQVAATLLSVASNGALTGAPGGTNGGVNNFLMRVTDVSYQVEWAGTISSAWSSAGVTQQILGDDGVTRTIRATLPIGATGQRFVRLKVGLK